MAVSLHTNRMANGKYPDQINIDNQLQYLKKYNIFPISSNSLYRIRFFCFLTSGLVYLYLLDVSISNVRGFLVNDFGWLVVLGLTAL